MTKTPYWPAALRLDQAAAYSGLCVETFKAVCPVQPIAFTGSTRGHRYLRFGWMSGLPRWIKMRNHPPRSSHGGSGSVVKVKLEGLKIAHARGNITSTFGRPAQRS